MQPESKLTDVLKELTRPSSSRLLKVSQERTTAFELTLQTVLPLVQAAGVTRLADVTGLDKIGLPVVMAVRPNSRALAVSQGKGLSLCAAKLSAIFEALESYHAERVNLPVYLYRWAELAGSFRAVDPRALPLISPDTFDADRRLMWVSALDVMTGGQALVPFELVHTDFTVPFPTGHGVFPMSSNGLGAGNTYAEAVLHGTCELIERDAWCWFVGANNPEHSEISIDQLDGEDLQRAVRQIQGAGCRLSIVEIVSPVEVPVFFAVVSEGSESEVTASPAGGLGCHPNRTYACLRAILEAVQSRLTRLSGARDDLTPRNFEFAPGNPGFIPSRSTISRPGYVSDTVEDDLSWTIGRLTDSGFNRVLVIDLARPEFGIPVVRVIVPGLNNPVARTIATRAT